MSSGDGVNNGGITLILNLTQNEYSLLKELSNYSPNGKVKEVVIASTGLDQHAYSIAGTKLYDKIKNFIGKRSNE